MVYRTRQELFNNAWNGFVKQNWKLSSEYPEGCAYRSKDGSRCAIGWNIDDAAYSSRLEGKGASNLIVQMAANIHADDTIFAIDLQSAHDYIDLRRSQAKANASTFDVEAELKNRMTSLASRYNLTIPNGVQ